HAIRETRRDRIQEKLHGLFLTAAIRFEPHASVYEPDFEFSISILRTISDSFGASRGSHHGGVGMWGSHASFILESQPSMIGKSTPSPRTRNQSAGAGVPAGRSRRCSRMAMRGSSK